MMPSKNTGQGWKYSDEQVSFVRMLVEKRAYTQDMLSEFTGIPKGSIPYLYSRHNIQTRNAQNGMTSARNAGIIRKRKLALDRIKYASQLKELFPSHTTEN